MSRSAASPALPVERFFEFSLLGLVASGFFAVAGSGYLDLPTAALTAAGCLLRGLMILGWVRLELSTRALTILTAAYIAFYPVDYLWISQEFLPATVHLVFFLAVIKMVTARGNRDYAFLIAIAFLELLAASVLSINLNFFAFLALFLLLGVATFASAEVRRSMRHSQQIVRAGMGHFQVRLVLLTVAVGVGILVFTAGLFFVLPRTAQAAFQRLVPQRYHLAGFSNEVLLGQIGEIQQRGIAVMHVRITSERAPRNLKWRGTALSRFDGKRWSNPPEAGHILIPKDGIFNLSEPLNRRPGDSIVYDVQLDAVASDALFLAGRPDLIFSNAPLLLRTSTNSYQLGYPASQSLRYTVYSTLERPSAPLWRDLPALADRARYVQVPRLDPRIPELARRITADAPSDEQRARAVEEYLRGHYGYTTQLLSQPVPDALANFLFERKRGHCEYFASAMAVLLRTLDIPARIANGFQSGLYNPVSGWYVVRASDAHSWVEAYLPERGWTTFDPTPADSNPPGLSLWSRLSFYLDAGETFWQEWVLNYDLNRQLTLASKVEEGRTLGTHWADRVRAGVAAWLRSAEDWLRSYGLWLVVAAVCGLAGWLLAPPVWAWLGTRQRVRKLRHGAARGSDATILYGRMLVLLKKRGIERPVWQTPQEFAATIPASRQAEIVTRFTQCYYQVRFGERPDAAREMVVLLDALENVPAR